MNNFETGLPSSFFQGYFRFARRTNQPTNRTFDNVDGDDEPSAGLIKFTWQMNVKMLTDRHTHTQNQSKTRNKSTEGKGDA